MLLPRVIRDFYQICKKKKQNAVTVASYLMSFCFFSGGGFKFDCASDLSILASTLISGLRSSEKTSKTLYLSKQLTKAAERQTIEVTNY